MNINPPAQLPVEVLSQILLCSVTMYKYEWEDDPIELKDQLKGYEAYRLVCHHWNNTMEGNPQFWATCGVTIRHDPLDKDDTQLEETLWLIRRHFSRSGALPLTLGFRLSFNNPAPLESPVPILKLVSCYNRWKGLHLRLWPEPSGVWDNSQDPWWTSFFRLSRTFSQQDCLKDLEELSLDCDNAGGDCISQGGDLRIYDLCPRITKLCLALRGLSDPARLLEEILRLQGLRWIHLAIDDTTVSGEFDSQSAGAALLVRGILTELPRLQYFEESLQDLDHFDYDKEEASSDGCFAISLINSTVETLVLTEASHLPFLMTFAFNSLKTVRLTNNFFHSGCDMNSTISELVTMLQNSPQLHSLRIESAAFVGPDAVALLSDLPSIRSLEMQLNPQLTSFFSILCNHSQTKLILPCLTSIVVQVSLPYDHNEESQGTTQLDIDAFKAFVTDPRRSSGHGDVETLRYAEFRLGNTCIYVRDI